MSIEKKLLLFALLAVLALPCRLMASVEASLGFSAGYIPSMGGNLGSSVQSTQLGVDNGIDGINRSQDGTDTEMIGRLIGITGGGELKIIVFGNYLVRVGANYARSIYGGKGKTIDPWGNTVKVEYAVWYYDFPFTLGISIPFWKDVRINLSGGIAYARGTSRNSFRSPVLDSSASFTGWALPRVIILSGEYFLDGEVALMTSLSYYQGATELMTNRGDMGRVDFTGYRWNIGFSYSYDLAGRGRKN